MPALIEPMVKDRSVEVWLMQKDGRILYDADKEEIGRMLFKDPMYQGYPESLARARKIAEDRAGSADRSKQIWQLLTLETWMRQHASMAKAA